MNSNTSAHFRSSIIDNSECRSDNYEIIFEKLEKHIEYLQKKLKQNEIQNEKLNDYIDSFQKKLIEKDNFNENLSKEIQNLHQTINKLVLEN